MSGPHSSGLSEQGDPRVRSRRVGAGLLIGGAGILLYRTVALLSGAARTVLRRWVVALTFMEMTVDVITVVAAARWWRTRAPRHARLPLRVGAAATLLHAVRVLVFIVGRTGPWVDFDVRPEHRADHRQRWRWAEVVFAGVMSTLGIIGVVVVWRVRRRLSHPARGATPAASIIARHSRVRWLGRGAERSSSEAP